MENILEIKNLEFTYPKKNKTSFFLSLDSFELDFGEKTAFVSPNGSGSWTAALSGYYLIKNANGSVTVGACEAENTSSITITQ